MRERKRREKEAAENRIEFNLTPKIEAEKVAKEFETREAQATAQADNMIENYLVNSRIPGAIDHSETDTTKTLFRKIKVDDRGNWVKQKADGTWPQFNAQASLKILQAAFSGEGQRQINYSAEKERVRLITNDMIPKRPAGK
jgi:hypothetical protein